ncbi:MAG: polysaccharide deacetylase family protein, partial [Pirellula sp.]
MTTAEFRSCIDYLVKHYYIATLNEILTSDEVDTDGKPALLITFDDAYRSVYTNALPMLREEGIPAVFFVNAALIGNRTLSTDNLVTYIANTFGLSTLVGFLRERAY